MISSLLIEKNPDDDGSLNIQLETGQNKDKLLLGTLNTATGFLKRYIHHINPNACQSIYLSHPKPYTVSAACSEKPHAAEHITNVININNELNNIYTANQTLANIDGKIIRIFPEHIRLAPQYDIIVKVCTGSTDHYDLTPVQKGYLIRLLYLHRKAHSVMPYYYLDAAWDHLLKVNFILITSPPNIHSSLMKYGVLSYLNITDYMIRAILEEDWDIMLLFIPYYRSSYSLNRGKILKYYIPDDIRSLLSYKSSPLSSSYVLWK